MNIFEDPERKLFKVPVLGMVAAIYYSDTVWMRAMIRKMKQLKPVRKRDLVQYAHELRVWTLKHPVKDRRTRWGRYEQH